MTRTQKNPPDIRGIWFFRIRDRMGGTASKRQPEADFAIETNQSARFFSELVP